MSDPRTLGDIVARRVARLEDSEQVRAYRGWHDAAGEQIRAVTWPGRLRQGVLVVECESAVWAAELSYLAPQLMERLRTADPQTPVERLRFTVRMSRR
jgi:predicted nucleic acid-binding Zn ribbon protein